MYPAHTPMPKPKSKPKAGFKRTLYDAKRQTEHLMLSKGFVRVPTMTIPVCTNLGCSCSVNFPIMCFK